MGALLLISLGCTLVASLVSSRRFSPLWHKRAAMKISGHRDVTYLRSAKECIRCSVNDLPAPRIARGLKMRRRRSALVVKAPSRWILKSEIGAYIVPRLSKRGSGHGH